MAAEFTTTAYVRLYVYEKTDDNALFGDYLFAINRRNHIDYTWLSN